MKARLLKLTHIIGLVLLVSSSPLSGQVNLDSCQAKALINYPLILQFDLIDQSKELTLSNANKAYLPQLDLNLIGGVIDGFPSFAPPGSEASSSADFNLISVVQINQLIWDGGITKANKGIIEANSEIEKAEMNVNLYQLEERINNLYFGVLLIDEQIAQLDLLLETLERNKKRIQNAVDNGTAFKSDVDELMVELIKVKQNQAELKYNKRAYIQVLSIMIGEEIELSQSFERPLFELETDSLSVNRPELAKFENQRALVEAKRKMDKSFLMPKIGLLGFGVFITPGVEFGTSSMTNLLVAGLSVSWSLGPLYKNGNNKKLNEISLQRIQNQEETFLFNTELELSQTELDLDKYNALIEQDKAIIGLKSSIKEAYVVKYDNGVSTMTQMLDKINEENVAKQNMIMHEIQYLMKAYQYLNKSGN